MDLSEIFGFLIILKETLVILPKNGKLVASIAFLSLLLSSILISLFVYFLQSLWANMLASYANPEYSDALYNPNNNNSNHVLKYTLLLLVVQLSFLFIFVIISNLLSTATILVSAFSYTGKKLDSKDLFSSIKRTWKKPFSRRFSSSSSSRFRSIAVVLAVIIVFIYPNFITISAAVIFAIVVYIFQLYSSVVSALSVVISIVEVSSRMEALEKAEKLVEGGQRLHGFMLNLFFNLVALILILPASYYYIDKLSVNKFAIYYGLFFLNFVSLLNIFVFTAYTVFYYWCKKHHGEEEEEKEEDINVQYSQLPALDSDIP
ncbi:hypothetical protein ABFS82_10G131900 [Erythranthe guttata]